MLTGLGVLASHRAHAAAMPWLSPDLPDGTRAEAHLVRPPDKQPLIQLTDRPPNLETPIQSLGSAITQNDQFFVRYHLAGLPDAASLRDWKLEIEGDAAERRVSLSMRDLNDLPQTEITAVCQCAGNRRGLVQPHVPGVQWGHGAVGCATWHGPRLRDVLRRAGIAADAVEVWLDGADQPTLPGTPEYRKSLPLAKALADETIVATVMNGAPLPLLNGFPARVVVGGWTATYWMKHLTRLTLSTKPTDNFWMKRAYRVPAGAFPVEQPFATQQDAATWPITDITVNSLIVTPLQGEQVERSGFTVRGIAWDKGSGIARVDVSADGGKNWKSAFLDRELSPHAFRAFKVETGPLPRGTAELRVRAVSNGREAQPDVWRTNPSGYHFNVPQRLTVTVA